MASKYLSTAKKLQTACNKLFGVKLLLHQRQWYSEKRDGAINQYILYQSINSEKGKEVNVELFRTCSQIQLVLFLRDFWYELNHWEIPHDNAEWEDVKRAYAEKNSGNTGKTVN